MQEPKQKKSETKQYFDIKSSSKPDPTSRPVINNEPIQSDPMMSAHNSSESEINQDNSNETSPVAVVPVVIKDDLPEGGLGVVQLDSPQTEEPSKADDTDHDMPDLSGDSNPTTVTDDELPAGTDKSSGEDAAIQLPETPAASDEEVHPSDFGVVGEQSPASKQTATQTSSNHEPPAAPALISQPFPLKQDGVFKNNLSLKIAIVALVVILLVIVSFIVYKFKSGQ
jgi:hypothetical protein